MKMINILPPEEARKIAAGEVIDRPSALIREFMDNALDAGAANIEVSIEGGGVARTEVSDDGHGMSREDLELCCLTHATSKIRTLADLDSSLSLGFRGEALAAAAAVTRLEILTSMDGLKAFKLESWPGKEISIEQGRRKKGTSVRAMGLFDTIPARKRFLKREGSEAVLCRNVFNDKALAFPDIGFRFFRDSKLKTFLPPHVSFKERFTKIALNEKESALSAGAEKLVFEITARGEGFEVIIVFAGPELSRGDRRGQYIFANGRRIQDFSLIQALEYGLRGLFPNGVHPVGAVFVNIDPALADFNIHPAKREVRFLDPGAIHHSITTTLENFRRKTFTRIYDIPAAGPETFPEGNAFNFEYNKENDYRTGIKAPAAPASGVLALQAAETPPAYATEHFTGNGLRLVGRIFDLFILVEYNEKLIIIDQHAAHERILYNSLIANPVTEQELLVPIPFQTENEDDDRFLESRQKDLAGLGIRIEKDGDGWRIDTLPAGWRVSASQTIKEILGLKTAGKNMAEKLTISLSCARAVKDGDYLDDESALVLAEQALRLTDLHCPHGRPILFEIERGEMLKAVKRT